MDFAVDDDLELIRTGVRDLCKKFPDEYWDEKDRLHEFPWDFYAELADGGWIGIAIGSQHGGGGRGITEAAAVLAEIAGSGAAMNGCSAVHLSIFGMHPLEKHGTEELKQKYLPAVADGSLHVAFGVTEPDAGTDTLAIRTSAVRDGDHYVVRGAKVWTSKALESDRVLLLVRTTPIADVKRRTDGLSLLMVDLKDPAVSITPIRKAGRNAVASCETIYDGVRVPVDDLVGDEGKGFRYLLDGLNAERILLSAEAIGIGRAALRRAADYASHRVVHGHPIGADQGVAFPLAEAYARLEAAELAMYRAAWAVDAGLPAGVYANTAKFLAAEAGFYAADAAMQAHGGFGYAEEFAVARYQREARLLRIAPIPQELVLAYLAQHALGLPKTY